LNIVVCMKQVPDTTAEKRLNADGTLDRAAVPAVVNPWDEYAIETALRLREAQGGEVTLLCMGPENAPETIRRALAMGADRAVLVTDPALHGSDMWATGYVLAQALKKLQFDMVLFGSQSTDAGGGIVYGIVAEILGLPQISWVNQIEAGGGKVRGQRLSDAGFDVVEAALPAVVSITQTPYEPRYPTLPNIMKAKKKELLTWSLADIGVDGGQVGLTAARTAVRGAEKAQTQRQNSVYVAEDPATTATYIADFLAARKLI
jgi:electron transfer flavoprotein beta subunit